MLDYLHLHLFNQENKLNVMRKILTILIIGLVSLTTVKAQQHVFSKGSLLFNVGIGSPVNHGYIPTFNISGEYGVIPTGDVGIVSFGGLLEFQFAQYDYWYGYAANVKPIFIIGPRASWHLQVFESNKWDVYGGVGFGVLFRGQPYADYYSSTVIGYGEIFVGGRLMFSEGFGLFAEIGGGTRSWGKFGISFGW